jgi:hypothetical protein
MPLSGTLSFSRFLFRILCGFLISPICAACTVPLILLDMFTLIVFAEESKLPVSYFPSDSSVHVSKAFLTVINGTPCNPYQYSIPRTEVSPLTQQVIE